MKMKHTAFYNKKNAIIVGLSKLPSAVDTAYSAPIIKSAFRDNGQIDESNEVMPNEKSLIGTYRGSIDENHYLQHAFQIIHKYYKETFLNGRIVESSFDNANVEHNRDSKGEVVSCDFDIA